MGLLEEAKAGNILIVTSALTIAEVLAMRGRLKISPERRLAVEQFFNHEYIAVQNLTRRLAEAAREVVWDYGVAPKDAIHVATAAAANVDAMNTSDGDLIKKSGLVGSPGLVICKPFVRAPRLDLKQPLMGKYDA